MISLDGGQILSTAIQNGKLPKLQYLNMSQCFNHKVNDQHIGPAAVEGLGAALLTGNCPELIHLDLNLNLCRRVGLCSIGQALASGSCPQLTHLDMASNLPNCVEAFEHVILAMETGKCQELQCLKV